MGERPGGSLYRILRISWEMNARTNTAILRGTTVAMALAAVSLGLYLNKARKDIARPVGGAKAAATPALPTATPPEPKVVRKSWEDLRSTNYAEFVAKLRAFGCPEQTVRDIVITEIAKAYALRRAEVRRQGKPYEYWRTQDPADPKIEREIAALQREQHKLVRDLFGIELASMRAQYWAEDNNPPEYDFLPEDKREKLMEMLARYDAKEEEIYSRSQGTPEPKDEQELRRLEQERAKELQALLTPEEREQYDMRYSTIAQTLRGYLGGIQPTEEEFQKLFRVYKKYEKDLSEGFMTVQATREQIRTPERVAAERGLQEEIRTTLGEARFAELQRSHDPAYETLVQVAQRFNLPSEIPAEVYNLKAQAEQQKFEVDSNSKLTPEQRLAALTAIAQETERALNSRLGPEVYQTYARAAGDWIEGLNQPDVQHRFSR
jgi:hypothetical protein